MRSKIRAKVTYYDEDTGEVIGEFDRAIFIGNKPFIDRNFTKFFVAFLIDILEDPDYGKGAWRLLVYIATNLNHDTLEVFLVPDITAKEIGVTRQAVYNWLNVLLKKGILEKKATHFYRLRPYTIVKGQMSKATETEPDF